jgi:hypothetical protein
VAVDVKKSGSTTAFTLSKNSGSFGTVTTATVVVTGSTAAPTGTVEITEKGKVLGTGELVVTGLKGTATIALPADLAVGTHQLTAVYAGSADVTGSKSQRSYRVTPATATAKLTADSWTVPKGTKANVTVAISGKAGAPAPTGSVTVMVGLQRVATVPLVSGSATITLPAAQRSGIVIAYYTGDRGYLPTAAVHTLTVRR